MPPAIRHRIHEQHRITVEGPHAIARAQVIARGQHSEANAENQSGKQARHTFQPEGKVESLRGHPRPRLNPVPPASGHPDSGATQAITIDPAAPTRVGGKLPRRAPDLLMISRLQPSTPSSVTSGLQGFLAHETFLFSEDHCM